MPFNRKHIPEPCGRLLPRLFKLVRYSKISFRFTKITFALVGAPAVVVLLHAATQRLIHVQLRSDDPALDFAGAEGLQRREGTGGGPKEAHIVVIDEPTERVTL